LIRIAFTSTTLPGTRVYRRELGRHKVNALADQMLDRDPDLKIERLPLDVIEEQT
jgi:hypothetical protein